MDLSPFFRSIIDQDPMPVVICDCAHFIVYMNPAAVDHYNDRGGKNLVGMPLFDCHHPRTADIIKKVVDWFAEDKGNNIVHTMYLETYGKDVYMVALRDTEGNLIGYYEKHESRIRDKSPLYSM